MFMFHIFLDCKSNPFLLIHNFFLIIFLFFLIYFFCSYF